jgi:hypothetical protein
MNKQQAVVFKEFELNGVTYQKGEVLEMEYDEYSTDEEISPWHVLDKQGNFLCDEESDFFFKFLSIKYD